MSCSRGNVGRSRPQKYQNTHAFKNTLHDTSVKTKKINNIQVVNVCERCKSIIEWKIKYKKYKPLKAASTCTKCQQKCVKHAYHIMCGPCAATHEVCAKCGEKREIFREAMPEETLKLDRELRLILKTLPERKRRTFLRYMHRKGEKKSPGGDLEISKGISNDEDAESNPQGHTEEPPTSRDDLLEKLKSLIVSKDDDDETFDNSDESAVEDSDDSSSH
ncbi:uncharacterized protein C9orf85 homolog [Fopius arisanus]|uniref:Uncharacterized protein C9orf85 homolog n=1 Tax=Fopius arisanus TaxID=64838 RepID=A0A9R1TVW7_9HYME|nr:PREDICTED: uncharacterized protein C9orf85 homolog [Fopius arisanus]